MKIAVYYDVPFGGAHVAMEEIILRLQKKHQVEIFHNQNSSFSDFPFRRLWLDLESILFQRGKQYLQAKKIDAKRFDVVIVSHDRHFQAPWVLRFLKTPTVLLCQEPTRAYFEEFLRVDQKLPVLNRLYELFNRQIRKGIEIKNAGFANKIISNSVYSSESIFRAYGIKSTPILLGFNPQDFFPEKIRRNNQVVLVGNNEPQKALPFAIDCVAMINKSERPSLVIVSPRSRDCRQLVLRAKKAGVVLSLHQEITTPRLRHLYNQSKLCIAVAHLEPFGLSVIESLACETQIVAINEAGYRETVVDGKSGILVERNAIKASAAIQNLLVDDRKRLQMGKYGLKDVKKRFSWDTTVEKIEQIFYEIT